MTPTPPDLDGVEAGLYDKRRIPIMPGDILKVYHFTAALRRKRHYMYKQVLERVDLGERKAPYYRISHLTFDPLEYYHEILDGRVLRDVEIVQGIEAYWDERPRLATTATEQTHE